MCTLIQVTNIKEMFKCKEQILSYNDSDSAKVQVQTYKEIIDSLYSERLHREQRSLEDSMKQMTENAFQHQRYFDHFTVS